MLTLLEQVRYVLGQSLLNYTCQRQQNFGVSKKLEYSVVIEMFFNVCWVLEIVKRLFYSKSI